MITVKGRVSCILKSQSFVQQVITKTSFVKFSTELKDKAGDVRLKYLTGAHQGIAIIGLDRAHRKNALSMSFVKSLLNSVEILGNEKNVRVVILRSLVDGAFCAGADLKERLSLSAHDFQMFGKNLRKLVFNIDNLPMPVIAAVDGLALGGGLELALACDLITVANDAKMGLVETKHAIIPGAGGTQRLSRVVSPRLAKELIFTARVFTGAEAKKMRIVNHSVAQNETKDSAFQKAMELAEEILPNGPLGVRMAKRAINKGAHVDSFTGYGIEEDCYSQLTSTKDRQEGLVAFTEKRKPNYTGE